MTLAAYSETLVVIIFSMKTFVTILLLATAASLFGQSVGQKELLEITNLALNQNKLPTELVNHESSRLAPWLITPYVVVKSDSAKGILRQYLAPTDNLNVWILDYEDIFLVEIPYGMVPLSLKRRGERVTIRYKTVKYPKKGGPSMTCHTGKLVADKKEGSWILVSSTTDDTKCEIDPYGRKK
jgi:hypothetical protein